MLEDASALEDLGLVLVWVVAFALASLAYVIAKAIEKALSVSILGQHPFRFIGTAIENELIPPLAAVVSKSEAEIARGLRGLLNSLELLAGLTLLALVGVRDALGYGWHAVIRPLLVQLADEAAKLTDRLAAEVRRLEESITHAISRAEDYTDGVATQTLNTSVAFAENLATAAYTEATRYADEAVAKLRGIEDAAIKSVNESLVAAGKVIGDLEREITGTVEPEIASVAKRVAALGTSLETVGKTAAEALRDAEAAATATALQQVKSIAVTAEDDIDAIVKGIGVAGVATLIAAIPAISTLVHAIASEAGLSDAACRAKVGNICSTNPARWGELLAGLGLVGVGFSLHEIVDAASGVVRDTAPLIADLAA